MSEKKAYQKFYVLLLLACMAGWLWLTLQHASPTGMQAGTVCLFKKTTGIPCPSCGVTRAVSLILNGQLEKGLATNPLGLLMLTGLLVTPFWMVLDAFQRKPGLYHTWKKLEQALSRKIIAIPLAALILINWIWNITKGL